MSESAILGADELDAIFAQLIVPAYRLDPSDEPTLYMVGAQPGAGKTRAIARVSAAHPEACEVNGDDLRVYHPDYATMMDADPLRMPELTKEASGAWVRMSLDYLRSHKTSAIVETTFAHPDANERTLCGFRHAGYRTVVIVVSTPAPLSLFGILERYVNQVEENGSGRWTDPASHDEAVKQLPGNVARLVRSGHVDSVEVIDRAGNALFGTAINESNHDAMAFRSEAIVSAGLSGSSIHDDQRQYVLTVLQQIRAAFRQTKGEATLVLPLVERLQTEFSPSVVD